MAKDIPDVFEEVVEVDETYLGGQKKNKRKSQLLKKGLWQRVKKRFWDNKTARLWHPM